MNGDRRAEALAMMDEWRAEGEAQGVENRWLTALRSVLERHEPFAGICPACRHDSPCPDESAVIDALLGVES